MGIISTLYTAYLSTGDRQLAREEMFLATHIESDLKQDLQSVLLHEMELPLVDIRRYIGHHQSPHSPRKGAQVIELHRQLQGRDLLR